jgi:hypothetical protein
MTYETLTDLTIDEIRLVLPHGTAGFGYGPINWALLVLDGVLGIGHEKS